MYQVIFSPTARKQFLKLDKEIKRHIIKALKRIRIRPEAHLKKLVGEPGFRLRVGDYRVIVDIDQGRLLILVIKVGHRKSIYK